MASLRAKLSGYQSQYAQLKAEAQLVPQVEAEFAQINRDYDIQKKTYETLLQQAAVGGDRRGRAGCRRHAVPRRRSTACRAAAGAADPHRAARHGAGGRAGGGIAGTASRPTSCHADISRCAFAARSLEAANAGHGNDAAERSAQQARGGETLSILPAADRGWLLRFAAVFAFALLLGARGMRCDR